MDLEFGVKTGQGGYSYEDPILGQPDECVDQLRKFKDTGFNNLILIFPNDTELRPLEVFKDKVIRQLR